MVLLVTAIVAPGPADASCNLVTRSFASFDGDQGALGRPFAAPGELLQVSLRDCDASSGLSANPLDHNVTVVFTPPTGPRTAVVLTSDLTCTGIQPQLSACEADLGPNGAAFCVPADESFLSVVEREGVRNLAFRFPDTDARCSGGTDAGSPCRVSADCNSGVCDPDDDDHTLSGPAMIVVTDSNAPLPCAVDSCATATGTVACVDKLYNGAGSCSTSLVSGTFPSFTALPPPNNFSTECVSPEPPCQPQLADAELRFGLDANGNVLAPFVWDGIREQLDGEAVARIVRVTIAFPLTLPGQSFVASYAPQGRKLSPVFEPKTDGGSTLVLFGSADAPYTILRLASGSDKGLQCVGGDNDALPCNSNEECTGGSCEPSVCDGGPADGSLCRNDADCPDGGLCGPKIFNLSALTVDGGVGPAVLPRSSGGVFGVCQNDTTVACTVDCGIGNPCVVYKLEAGLTVPLDGLVPRDEIGNFTATERIDLIDLNKDDDTSDVVMTERDQVTGALLELGPPPASCNIPVDPMNDPVVVGRAVLRTSAPPLLLPAGATEGDVLAFLESESGQGGCDLNDDDDSEDGILRVFDSSATELTGTMNIGVDANPVINDRSLVVSDGLVFYRSSEPQRAKKITARANTTSGGGQAVGGGSSAPQITSDGLYAGFLSSATNLFSPAPNGQDVYLKRLSDGAVYRVNDNFNEDDPNANASGLSMTESSFGNPIVVFESVASNIDPSDPPPLLQTWADVFRVSGRLGTPDRISRPINFAAQPNAASAQGSPSRLGTAFASDATNLLNTADTNAKRDVYYQPIFGNMVRISDSLGGQQGNGTSERPAMARDVFVIAFESTATNLVTPDSILRDIFVYDATGPAPTLERVSTGVGGRANSTSQAPAISADGRFVSFESLGTNLVVGDTNGVQDVFVRDRLLGITERVSVATGGQPANDSSDNLAISPEGRYVLFSSAATNLVTGDTNGNIDYFVHDRVTRTTARANVNSLNQQTNGEPGAGSGDVSDVGVMVFSSAQTDLVAGDTNGASDVFIRRPDPSDPLGIDAALEPNGQLVDTVLQVFDAANPGSPSTIGPAEAVKVAGNNALFVAYRGNNGVDPVVVPTYRFWSGANPSVKALGFTAYRGVSYSDTMVMTDQVIAALDGEADQWDVFNEPGDINADGDTQDGYLIVHDLCSPIDSCNWSTPLGVGGRALVVADASHPLAGSGDIIALLVDESEYGPAGTNLNPIDGDNDLNDNVLHVYDASDGSVTNLGLAVVDFVVGERATPESCHGDPVQLVAFRVSESDQNKNLNGPDDDAGLPQDSDKNDTVLFVYDAASGAPPINTGQAAIACQFAACDPRTPYRVEGSTVLFLTRESDQGDGFGQDLNADGDSDDIVLQQYDYCTGALTPLGAASTDGTTDPTRPIDGSRIVQTEAGRCDDGPCGVNGACDTGEFCDDDTCSSFTGLCYRNKQIACSADSDCKRCILRVPDTCTSDDECLGNATCLIQLVTAVASTADSDADGIPDDIDVCPANPDPLANDVDNDGVPDACDLRSCSKKPRFGCLAPAPEKSLLLLTDESPDSKDKLIWKWAKGDAVAKSDFGDPLHFDTYEMCIYDSNGLAASALVPPSGTCDAGGRKPCWKEKSNGFKYKDALTTPLGVQTVVLKEGIEPGKAKVIVKARGARLDMPVLPQLTAPLIVQLVNDSTGECFNAGFEEPFLKRTDTQIKAKGGPAVVTTTTMPPPCPDADLDTFQDEACGGTDCYDANFDARPNQTTFFPTNRGDGSFDYNCDGVQEKRWQTGHCFVNILNFCILASSQQGFLVDKACGQSGAFATGCTGGSANCTEVTENRTQECR